ncbi:MAG: LytTR family DNA-binding domain-containing protein, partial [Cryomorphaceae bacterium]
EVKNREGLARMINQFCHDVNVVGEADGVDAAIGLIDEHHPELVFLDIEMPGKNGFSLLEHYEDPKFQVIFTTAHAEYAIKAIKFAALDYLLKPVNLNELKVAVEKAIRQVDDGGNDERLSVLKESRGQGEFKFQRIALPTAEGVEFYTISDILRCEADRAYCRFHMVSKQAIIVSKPLSDFEDMLQECNFMRIHKSNMVNMSQVKKYVKGRGGYVVLTDGSHVDVSVRRKEEVMKALGIN